MELWALQQLADGTASLAELEKKHPVLGGNLKHFVTTINRCCHDAYSRFSACLDDVLTLPINPTGQQADAVQKTLRDASDSTWFREVARICDDLAVLATTYDAGIRAHNAVPGGEDAKDRHSIMMMLTVLHEHEGDLKQDIRRAVDHLKQDIADSRVPEARQRAMDIKEEIERNLARINRVAGRITGSGADGADELLKSRIAEDALRKPERVLVFNMAMVAMFLILGATVLQFVSLLAFPLLTGFVLTAVVVVNAFYLRSIDKLKEESFLELMRLALLKFFAPLSHRPKEPPGTGA